MRGFSTISYMKLKCVPLIPPARWPLVLGAVLSDFPEVRKIRFGRVGDGVFLVLEFASFVPLIRARELELRLRRMFPGIRPVCVRPGAWADELPVDARVVLRYGFPVTASETLRFAAGA